MALREAIRMGLLVTPYDAGTATGVSYRTIRRLVAKGKLADHGETRGRRHYIKVDLDEAMDLLGDPLGLR